MEQPSTMTHVMVDREERLQHGITDGLVRFSVGYAHSCPCGLFKQRWEGGRLTIVLRTAWSTRMIWFMTWSKLLPSANLASQQLRGLHARQWLGRFVRAIN